MHEWQYGLELEVLKVLAEDYLTRVIRRLEPKGELREVRMVIPQSVCERAEHYRKGAPSRSVMSVQRHELRRCLRSFGPGEHVAGFYKIEPPGSNQELEDQHLVMYFEWLLIANKVAPEYAERILLVPPVLSSGVPQRLVQLMSPGSVEPLVESESRILSRSVLFFRKALKTREIILFPVCSVGAVGHRHWTLLVLSKSHGVFEVLYYDTLNEPSEHNLLLSGIILELLSVHCSETPLPEMAARSNVSRQEGNVCGQFVLHYCELYLRRLLGFGQASLPFPEKEQRAKTASVRNLCRLLEGERTRWLAAESSGETKLCERMMQESANELVCRAVSRHDQREADAMGKVALELLHENTSDAPMPMPQYAKDYLEQAERAKEDKRSAKAKLAKGKLSKLAGGSKAKAKAKAKAEAVPEPLAEPSALESPEPSAVPPASELPTPPVESPAPEQAASASESPPEPAATELTPEAPPPETPAAPETPPALELTTAAPPSAQPAPALVAPELPPLPPPSPGEDPKEPASVSPAPASAHEPTTVAPVQESLVEPAAAESSANQAHESDVEMLEPWPPLEPAPEEDPEMEDETNPARLDRQIWRMRYWDEQAELDMDVLKDQLPDVRKHCCEIIKISGLGLCSKCRWGTAAVSEKGLGCKDCDYVKAVSYHWKNRHKPIIRRCAGRGCWGVVVGGWGGIHFSTQFFSKISCLSLLGFSL